MNISRPKIFRPFREIVTDRHEYAKKWKAKTGGKVIGYFCTYVPEEIICAANILPVRIIGNNEPQTITDRLCSRNKWCPFSRNCLAEGLLGNYDYLDGVVLGASCFHTQEVFAAWVKHIPLSFWHYLFIPGSLQSTSADTCLVGEFEEFKSSLETWTGASITTEALDRAIETYNKNRQLMKALYELRKYEPPMLAGSEAMQTVLASQLMDKSEHNNILKEVLAQLSDGKNNVEPAIRLMVLGSENNDIDLLRAIESWGANIVIDDHCVGSRYFWGEITPHEDRLRAIAKRYIERPPCPTKDFPLRRRLPHILGLIKEFKVQTAVIILQKFCEPHQYDLPAIESGLQELHIPSVVIEIDAPISMAQIRTRVESLIDMLRVDTY
ncbi:MAG: 2-hydroxyacyl-CoA dehydratase [Deltaproteobacteria bacterium]|nr:2-hydroxyacyl-CoA dehydratase [Deltaproteobacteria bacterium]